jgi:hypothetical protein
MLSVGVLVSVKLFNSFISLIVSSAPFLFLAKNSTSDESSPLVHPLESHF